LVAVKQVQQKSDAANSDEGGELPVADDAADAVNAVFARL
jgi:hypothetical protein